MYEPAIADAAAGCHKLQLGRRTEADATRAGLVSVAVASAATGSRGVVLPEPAGRSPQQQWRHTRVPRLLDRSSECRCVKLLGCDKRLQPGLGLHHLAPPRHASITQQPDEVLPRERGVRTLFELLRLCAIYLIFS